MGVFTHTQGSAANPTATMSIQRRMYERQIDARRQREMFENEMGEVSKYHRKMVEVAKSDGRVEQKRREQEIAAANFEMKREQKFIQEEKDGFRSQVLKEQEERIAAELHRRKIEEFRDEKFVQKIRESSEELRELEEKLKAAYMTKERKAQICEKAVISQIRNEEEVKLDMMMEEDRRRGVHMDAKEQYMRKAAALEAQGQLEEQILEHDHQKELAYQAYLEEKAKVDALVTKIQDEDRAEMEAVARKKSETQGWIASYLDDRRQWKKRSEQGAWEAKKQAEQDFKDRMCAEIAAEIRKKEMEREELEDIRETLALEEEEERLRRKEEGERKKREDDRAMMMAAAEEAKMVKAARLEKEREEEAQFRDAMLQKFAEEDRLEQMSAQRRRMKQLEHKREVERLMEERRKAYEEQRLREATEREIEERAERFRQEIIERERQRLLEEHLPHLAGNIPKGVLQKEEDAVYLQ